MGKVRIRAASVAAVAVVALAGATAACGGGATAAPGGPFTLRLGYFPNVTHATAIVGVERGIFAGALGPGVRLRTATFNAGPAAVEALFSGAVDASYLGPNPAINAFARSGGKAIRIVSGATSGGAALVVKPAIDGPAALRGKKLASPQLGGTQDVALRHWLASQGLRTDLQGGGDVSVVPQDNAQTLETFRAGVIDGAWVPEPWATRLVREGGGKVLVDERDLWPAGRFVTTQLVVRTELLRQHPRVVADLVRAQVEADRFLNANPEESRRVVDDAIGRITGKKLDPAVVAAAWAHLTFTDDPLAATLRTAAAQAHDVGLLPKVNLKGIYELGPLDAVLGSEGLPAVSAR